MARVVKQVLLGNSPQQVHADFADAFDGEAIVAAIRAVYAGGGYAYGQVDLWYDNPTYSNRAYVRPDYLEFRSYFDNYQNRVLFFSENSYGGDLRVYKRNAGELVVNSPVFTASAGHPTGSVQPYARIADAALIIDSDEANPTTLVLSGMVNLFWDDTNKRMNGKDSGAVDYAFGYNDRGDPASYDLTEATMTLDGTWYDWDLSGIVPAGAKAVVLNVEITDNLAGKCLGFRKNGNSNAIAIQSVPTQAANNKMCGCLTVACDSARKIEYAGDAGIDNIDIVVTGWFI